MHSDADEPERLRPSLPSNPCTPSAPGGFGPDRITQSVYDAAGQLLQAIKAEGLQNTPGSPGQFTYATYTYTPNGKEQTVTDANGNKTTFIYDGFDRLSQSQFPAAGVGAGLSDPTNYEAYTYDNNDNRLSLRKRDGTVLSYCYDSLNREIDQYLHAISSCAPPPALGVGDTATTYDLLGHRLSSMFSGGVGVTYSWDAAGRQLSESTNGRTLSFAYDGAGNRTSVQWPDGFYVSYTYDSDNRTSAICERITSQSCQTATSLAQGLLFNFSYDGLGRRTAIVRSNGTSTTTGYDTNNRITSLNFVYGQSANNESWSFGYNPANQLVSQSASNDALNWTSFASTLAAKAYDGLNRDAGIAALGPQPCSPSSGYDCRGDLANEGASGRTFTYDADGRLVSIGGASSLSLTYDPAARLQSTASTASGTTNFLYDGDRLAAEYDGSGNLLRRYIFAKELEEPLIWYDAGGSVRRWLHGDRHGSVVSWSDDSGALTATQSYGPYGEPQSWAGSRFAYTGQIMLPEAQLYYYKARVYDPIAARYLQTDPIGYKDDLDLYLYVHDDPLNASDPTGRNCTSANGTTTCTTAVYEVSFKTPPGWQDPKQGQVKYHFYSTPAQSPESYKNTLAWLKENPTPGSVNNPATRTGNINDATPGYGTAGYFTPNVSPVLSILTVNKKGRHAGRR